MMRSRHRALRQRSFDRTRRKMPKRGTIRVDIFFEKDVPTRKAGSQIPMTTLLATGGHLSESALDVLAIVVDGADRDVQEVRENGL